jgi:cytosol alanyl aminopeptidase
MRRPLRNSFFPRLLALAGPALVTQCVDPEQVRVEAPRVLAAPGARVVADANGRLSSLVTPATMGIDLDLDPEKEVFSGAVTFGLRFAVRTEAFELHGRDLSSLGGAVVGDLSRSVTVTAAGRDRLLVEVSPPLDAGDHAITIRYEGRFTQDLAGLYRVEAGDAHYVFTQFEAVDARRAFPCFDEPAFKVKVSARVTTPERNIAVANSRVVEERVDGGVRTTRFAETLPLSTYLVAFAVGPFDVREGSIPPNEVRKTALPFRGVAVKGKGDKLEYAMRESAPLLATLERYFGIPYPFDKLDILAVPDFGGGAMENAGAVTFREALLLLDPKTATEGQRRAIVDVAAHEYAHQWFGNLVTMKWWDDLWLNEAFATWLGEKTVRTVHPDWESDLDFQTWVQGAMDTDSLLSARVIRQPIRSEGDIEAAFDALTYSKGGGLIAMFERFVGEEAFRDGIRRYMKRFELSNATTDEFLGVTLGEKRPELIAAFKQFLDRPGVPSVAATTTCKAGLLDALTVDVERYLPLGTERVPTEAPWILPLCVETSSGRLCKVLETRAGSTRAAFDLPSGKAALACPKFVLPNDGGEHYVRFTPDSKELAALLGVRKSLTPRERLALADSVTASFRKGRLPAKATADALIALASDPVDAVRFAGLDTLRLLAGRVLDERERTALERRVLGAFEPTWKKLGWSDDPARPSKNPERDSITRGQVFAALAMVARDPALRAEAAKRGRALVERGLAEKAPFDAELLPAVLAVGVADDGLFDALVAALHKTDDPIVRRAALGALGHAAGREAAEKRLALLLSGKLRESELPRFLFGWFDDERIARDSWAVLEKNLGDVVAKLPEGARDRVPMVLSRLCDASREDSLRRAFASHLPKMDGGQLALDNALEQGRICSAIVRAARVGAP